MFSPQDLDLQFDFENESISDEQPVKTSTTANIFREPSRLEHNITSAASTDSPINAERPKATAVRRKFPGPAGLLPDKPSRKLTDSSANLENLENDVRRDEPIFCSQSSESIFNEPQFEKLKTDFGLDKPDSPLNAFTVDWVKKKALSKGLKSRKIPFLAVILQSVDCSSADPLVTLRDPTGELFGALDPDAWKEMSQQFQPGVAIVLKEVGVLSTGVTRRQVILNMTKNNILSIYSSTEGKVFTDTVQPTTKTDILRNVADWQARAVQNSSPKPPSPAIRNSLFVQHSPASSPGEITYQNKSKPFRPHFLQKQQTESNFELFSDDIDFSSLDDGNHEETKRTKPNANEKVPYNPDNQTVLSQAETSMLDDVLNGVELDDF